jgi:hypothetical protein
MLKPHENVDMYEAALSYEKLGFSVIPIIPNTKRPAVEWKPYQNRRATQDELKEWFNKGQAHIGLVCGAISGNLTILDFDDPQSASKTFNMIQIQEATPVVKTARGLHIWFLSDQPIRSFNIPELKLNVLGEGHFAMAPPSKHPGGVRYEFLSPLKEPYRMEHLEASIRKLTEALGVKTPQRSTLPSIPKRILNGDRNTRLFSFAVVLRELGVELEQAKTQVLAMNQNACENPLEAEEVVKLVESAYSKPYHKNAATKLIAAAEGNMQIPPLTPVRTIEELQTIYSKHLRIQEDIDVVDVISAAMLDRLTPGDPLWLVVVGVPGSLKTEILRAMCHSQLAFQLSNLTPKTIISGKETKTGTIVKGIYSQLDGKVVVISELSQILTKRRDDRDAIFSQLRDLYDGYVVYGYGSTDEPIKAHCRIGLIAGVTGAIDMYGSIHAAG